jgi:hypothetical protein
MESQLVVFRVDTGACVALDVLLPLEGVVEVAGAVLLAGTVEVEDVVSLPGSVLGV